MEKRITKEEFLEILKDPPASFVRTSNIGETICFENLTFKYFQFNYEIEIERHVSFMNVQFDSVTIRGLKTTKNVTFQNVISSKNSYSFIEIEAKQLNFTGFSKFEGGLNIENCKIDFLSFSYMHFDNHVVISKCTLEEVVLAANFHAIFFSSNSIRNLRVYGGNINEFHVSSGDSEYLGIYGPVNVKETFISGGNIGLIHIDSAGLDKLNIKNYDGKYANLQVDTIKIVNTGKNHLTNITCLLLKKLQYAEGFASKESIFRVYDVGLEDLTFSNFINYGQINLTNVEISNTLSFASSDVGKLSFIACNLENASLDFSKSKVIETFIIGSDFPTKFKEGNSEEDKVEAYGQIKKTFENRGAQKNALEYYSLEMNALSNTDAVKKNFWERFNLLLNWASTNHGVSWKRGFISTVLISVGLYTLYICSLSAYVFNPWEAEYRKEFWEVASYYFEFINPAHRADIVSTNLNISPPTSLSRFVEGGSRIIMAYLIYQLIQAFRKHGKK